MNWWVCCRRRSCANGCCCTRPLKRPSYDLPSNAALLIPARPMARSPAMKLVEVPETTNQPGGIGRAGSNSEFVTYTANRGSGQHTAERKWAPSIDPRRACFEILWLAIPAPPARLAFFQDREIDSFHVARAESTRSGRSIIRLRARRAAQCFKPSQKPRRSTTRSRSFTTCSQNTASNPCTRWEFKCSRLGRMRRFWKSVLGRGIASWIWPSGGYWRACAGYRSLREHA